MRSVYCCFALSVSTALTSISCVSSGKFHAMVKQAHLSDSLYTQSMRTLTACQDDNKKLTSEKSTLLEQNRDMTQQVTAANEVNGQLRKQMEQLAAVSSAQAESIKRSLDNMGAKDSYMIALHSAIASRDSVNLAVLFQLKQAIGGYGEPNVIVKLEKGAVHVDLSDSLLFNGDSSSFSISDKAKQVLGRMARVLKDRSDIDITVESRIDSGMLQQDSALDAWGLSLRRSAAIVRTLQTDYHLDPAKMMAAGSVGSFATPSVNPASPADSTQTPPAIHATRVTIRPRVDQLTQLLEHGPGQAPPPPPPAPTAYSGKL
jgi:chemotaxis protein MotB